MKKKELCEYLRKSIFPSAKLPSKVSFEIVDGCLILTLEGKGVVSNMQTDDSAFEGWSIVLKAALQEVQKVVLKWEDPVCVADNEWAQRAHYNRFLMRVTKFKQAYSWFDISEDRLCEVDKMRELIESNSLVVNFPRRPCSPVTDKTKKQEAELERKLVEQWSKECPITDEQLPVGLFCNGIVSKANTLTPRGASQIDLWQLDNDTMRVHELKVKGNESVGIISELFFYVCTIKDIVDGHIKYPDVRNVKSYRHFKDFVNAVANGEIHKIMGYFTAPRLHPLIGSAKIKDKIFEILNANSFGIGFEYKNISHITEEQ